MLDMADEICYTACRKDEFFMIQIYACKRNFDVQKAERYFKERKIAVQFVDMGKKGPSKKEVQLFIQKLGIPGVFDVDGKLYQGHLVRFTNDMETIVEKIMAEPQLLKTPIVRNGQQVTAGYEPKIWDNWK